jgi:hypothetical protein
LTAYDIDITNEITTTATTATNQCAWCATTTTSGYH